MSFSQVNQISSNAAVMERADAILTDAGLPEFAVESLKQKVKMLDVHPTIKIIQLVRNGLAWARLEESSIGSTTNSIEPASIPPSILSSFLPSLPPFRFP